MFPFRSLSVAGHALYGYVVDKVYKALRRGEEKEMKATNLVQGDD